MDSDRSAGRMRPAGKGTSMNKEELRLMQGFYENELKNRFLSFWLPRCEDTEYGGFVNCFTNDGAALVSRDKYCWSQGRFVWMFSKLSSLEAPVFSAAERAEFLRLAAQGAEFLMKHALLPDGGIRCAFLLEADGTPKYERGCDCLDASIYADCFVAAGLARYASVSGRTDAFRFAEALFDSIVRRVAAGSYHTLPYPLSDNYRAHGVPMILENVTAELVCAARVFRPEREEEFKRLLAGYTEDVLSSFADENNLIREIIYADGGKPGILLGRHINPGHTIEDVWFMLDSMAITGNDARKDQVYAVAKQALETGWDKECGGILHFAGLDGGRPEGDNTGAEEEPMSRLLSDWGSKLWWVHSEALYTTLRCYFETGDEAFLAWHKKVFDYAYSVFPNPDPDVREWIQIRDREGRPQNKVVALPVKDPYHVVRNLCLILELLCREV